MNDVEPLLLWVPVNQQEPEETDDLIQKVTLANNAVLDFSEGIISLDDTFQIIEHYGADVDDYRENLAEIARTLGV
jgi:hypothetical protein